MIQKLSTLTILLSFLGAGHAHADKQHYKDILIGERAAGMGGAYVAVSDDPSGIIYNPAGIMFTMENYFSLSANTYFENTQTYRDVFGGQDYKYVSRNLVPDFFGFTQNYGKAKWGFAIVVPRSDLFDQDDYIQNISTVQGGPSYSKYKHFQQDTIYEAGPAFAFEIKKDVTLGFSLLYVMHMNKVIDNQFVGYNADAGGVSRYTFEERSLDQTIYSYYPKLGLQAMVTPKFSFGLTAAQMINNSGTQTRKSISSAVSGTPARPVPVTGDRANDVQEPAAQDADVKDPGPVELATGIAYFPNKHWLFAADVNYAGEDVGVVATWNAALGIESYITDGFALRLGAFTNNANTPEVVATSSNQQPHVDMLGGTLSFSFVKPGSSFTFGAMYSTGVGKGQPLANSTMVCDVEQTSAALFITGSYQL